MRSIGLIIVIAVIMFGISIVYDDLKYLPEISESYEQERQNKSKQNVEDEKNIDLPKEGMVQFMSMNQDELITKIGEPDQIDPTRYGYQWWTYQTESSDQYIQFGMDKGVIVSIFVLGNGVDISPLKIGQKVSEIKKFVNIDNQVSMNVDGNHLRFDLTKEEVRSRPLVEFDGVWAQLYIDTFKNSLVGVRYMNPNVLAVQRPYSLEYRGELIESPKLTDEDIVKVQNAEKKQVFNITNIIRKQYGVSPLKWHEQVAKVAFGHSKEMNIEQYFSHESPISGTLSDRLEKGDVKYVQAGENIAANYIDGIAAVYGWLNSEGHRKAMLSEDFTHLGVGVYEKHYTQNFIVPFE
ncbi:CAP domain-containing protein [Pseudalkalibacillus berkeleyi]|uniref:CAP domain-containing protein n=1 Tax=Pseudalkalibacillus berkeleyi TaxID=1069813 RepID=A0ABS9GZA8_9BACL|nr:CAP domain-containing protein [Pseudalkalibacillus berkeleyi]MCF6136979.1 CAP domain-containing protein [Pseudalkalibacillus berkeleyi]